jgi:hypothetical protein
MKGYITIIASLIGPYNATTTSSKKAGISGYYGTEVFVNYSGLSIIT